MKSLDEKKWGQFRIGDLYSVKRPAARNKDDYESGRVPFIASGAVNNGVMKYCTPRNNEHLNQKNCITVSPVDGSSFYQEFDFLGRGGAGSSILMLYSDDNEKLSGQFIARMIANTCSKYTYGHMGNINSIKREFILLPVTDDGKPDYEYMAEYVRQQQISLLDRYQNYISEKLQKLGNLIEIPTLDEKAWEPFAITDLFDFFEAGKGKGLNHLEKTNSINGISYIGATNKNNGVLCYVKKNIESEKLLQSGNCIGFIKNGDGSAGYAIYKSEDFISTSDLIYGYANWLNEYTGLFFVAAQDMIENKYSHGYKRNMQHLSGDRVMLPVNETDNPDYKFMEQYVKNMMIKKYHQYLNRHKNTAMSSISALA